jgi:hypothetical protein
LADAVGNFDDLAVVDTAGTVVEHELDGCARPDGSKPFGENIPMSMI